MVGLTVMCQVYVHLYIALDKGWDHVHFVPLEGVKLSFHTTKKVSEWVSMKMRVIDVDLPYPHDVFYHLMLIQN